MSSNTISLGELEEMAKASIGSGGMVLMTASHILDLVSLLRSATEHATRIPVDILDEARNLVLGERAESYGAKAANFGRIAALWNAYMMDEGRPLSAFDISQMMILMKVARNYEAPSKDSLVDIAGYALCGDIIFQENYPR